MGENVEGGEEEERKAIEAHIPTTTHFYCSFSFDWSVAWDAIHSVAAWARNSEDL